jgi:serine O-acetyltransferase
LPDGAGRESLGVARAIARAMANLNKMSRSRWFTAMFDRLRENIDAIRQKDPAARSMWEVLTCYPGLHALMFHSLAHCCWRADMRWLGRFISHLGRFFTGIEIHPGAKIGRRVFIDHGMGVVIGETAEVGDDCTIYQGVTLGGTSLTRGAKRHPTLEPGVIVGANAQVLGGFTVGEGAKIGSNAVVVKPVPAGATAVGNPARVIAANAPAKPAAPAIDGVAGVNGVAGVDGVAGIVAGMALPRPFAAYGITPNADDPMSLAIHGLIDLAAQQSSRIDELTSALERLGAHLEQLDGCDVSIADLRKLGEVIQNK